MREQPRMAEDGRLWTPGSVDFFRTINEQVAPRRSHPAVLCTACSFVIDHQRETLKGKARILLAPKPYSACLLTARNAGFSDLRHRASLTRLFTVFQPS